MSKLTITEALQEIKTINSRILKKREGIAQHVVRDSRIRDPFEKEGGSDKFIAEERQSIKDLENRIIKLRIGIQRVNQSQDLTIEDTTKTVAEWLVWRREVAPNYRNWLSQTVKGIQEIRQKLQRGGGNITASKNVGNVNISPDTPIDGVVFLDEYALHKEMDEVNTIFGALDGKLSWFNAITSFEIM